MVAKWHARVHRWVRESVSGTEIGPADGRGPAEGPVRVAAERAASNLCSRAQPVSFLPKLTAVRNLRALRNKLQVAIAHQAAALPLVEPQPLQLNGELLR
jgi:hypothetical protein